MAKGFSNRAGYGLAWSPRGRVTTTQYALYAVQLAALIIISWFSTVSSTVVGPGIGLYWATPFLVLFTLWWGGWGILGSYVGSVVGGGLLTGAPLLQALTVNICNLIPLILIFVLYRGYLARTGVDPMGRDIFNSRKAAFWFVFWIMLVTNAVQGLIGVGGLVIFGAVPPASFLVALGAWIVGNIIVLIAFPFMSRYLTPVVERYGLLTRGWVS